MILSATLGAAVWSDRRNPEILRKPLDSISTEIDGWRSLGNQTLQDRIAASLDATSYLSRIYRKGPDELDMFTAFYAQQKAGESMHSPKYCLPGGGWEFTEFRKITLPTPGGPATVNRAAIQRPGSRAIMFYWYQSRTRIVASEYESKIFLVWDGLIHANPGGSIVRVMLPDRPDAERQGVSFASKLVLQVQSCLRE
jgi:EpsI family protein